MSFTISHQAHGGTPVGGGAVRIRLVGHSRIGCGSSSIAAAVAVAEAVAIAVTVAVTVTVTVTGPLTDHSILLLQVLAAGASDAPDAPDASAAVCAVCAASEPPRPASHSLPFHIHIHIRA